jgi:putative methyltransferase
MRVGFLSPNGIFLPYVWGTLRAYVESNSSLSSHVKFLKPITTFDIQDSHIKMLANCDVILVSCYVWNHVTVLKVISEVKKLNSRVVAIFGGPHVPNHPQHFFENNPCVDLAVHGEGELAITTIFERLISSGGDFSEIHNVSNRCEVGRFNDHGLRPKDNLDLNFQSPFLMGYFDEIIERNHNANFPFLALWETNRGCPFSCSFCDWGSATMSKVRKFPMDRLRSEIQYFADRKVTDLLICDANFGMLERDLEIANLLSEAKCRTGFPGTIRVSYAKNSPERVFDIGKKFADSGMLWGTTLSMQSVNPDTMKSIKRQNIRSLDFRTLAEKYRKNGIHFYTELIFPLPEETLESFIDGIDQMLVLGNHFELRIFELSLLPNAALAQQREQYGLKTISRPLFRRDTAFATDTVEVVVETAKVTRVDWKSGFLYAELIVMLHNGGYLQFISRFLHRERNIKYATFYRALETYFSNRQASVLGNVIESIKRILDDYLVRSDMPQKTKLMFDSDINSFLSQFGNRNSWFILHYGWLKISQNFDIFYSEIENFLSDCFPEHLDEQTRDLLYFQTQIMLRPDYDVSIGKICEFKHDWLSYFGEEVDIQFRPGRIRFRDTGFGPDLRYIPVANDLVRFADCAVGLAYPESKLRHFVHDLRVAEVAYFDKSSKDWVKRNSPSS